MYYLVLIVGVILITQLQKQTELHFEIPDNNLSHIHQMYHFTII